MARLPVIALHARLDALGDIATSIDANTAGETRLVNLETRMGAAEDRIAILVRRQYLWLFVLLMLAFDPKSRKFLDTHPVGKLLVDAKYTDAKAVAEAKAPRGKKPWDKIHADLSKLYQSDPKTYAPPPDPIDLEILYEVCVANS